jgi:Transposase DNA-binding
MDAMAVETEDWIETEFGTADLGDARRTQRLLQLSRQLPGFRAMKGDFQA